MKRATWMLAVLVVLMDAELVKAESVVFSISPTVTSVDRIATFDSLTSTSLYIGNYAEDMLSVTTPINLALSVGFTPFAPGDFRTTAFYYGSGGSDSYVTIRGADGAVFTAIDLLLGDGEAPHTTNVRWQTFLDGSLTGEGFMGGVTKGQIVGWSDASGFDELRVAASSGSGVGEFSVNYQPGFGNFQSIAIDDLRAQVAPPTPVPEPASLALIPSGIACVVGYLWCHLRRNSGRANA
jgi:hypothetical protein